MIRVVFCLIYLLLFLPAMVSGDEPEGLSLEAALRLAYSQNPRVVVAREEVNAAKGRWIQAGAYPNPEFSISSTEISQGVRGGSTVGEDEIELTQEVDLFMKVPLRKRTAQSEYEAATHMMRQVWNEVAFEVTRSYNDLLLSTQEAGVTREVLGVTRRLLDQVQLRYNAGEALQNELLRAQIEVVKAENAVLEAEKKTSLDRAELNVLLGHEAQKPLKLIDDLTYEPRDFNEEQLLRQAIAKRPDLKSEEALLKAGQKRLQLAYRDRVDNPSVSAIGTREGEEKVFGLAVSWPLPFWNRNQGTIQEAKAGLAQRETERDALSRQIGLEVMQAIAEVRLAQRQVTAWRAAVEQANELMQLATLQYGEGDLNFITYLDHLATVRETKVSYVEALANYRTQLAMLDQVVAQTLEPTLNQEEPS